MFLKSTKFYFEDIEKVQNNIKNESRLEIFFKVLEKKILKTKGGKYSKMQCVQKWIWVMNVLLTNRRLRPSIRALGATQQQATIRHVVKR